MRVLVFDNYDSFTYNLVHMVEHILQSPVDVYRNDAIALDEVAVYDKIILSPGPGIPEEAGLLLPLIERYAATKSILGVCLGHQAIGQAFGGKLTNLSTVFHGIATSAKLINRQAKDLYEGLDDTIEIGRYHSWVVDQQDFPDALEITAVDDQNYIMGLRHKHYDVQGVQFHPESVLTPQGATIIQNWLKQVR
ncbi:MAG: aminodeoxychorismate/anthranilate synthase component II [Chitinophagaceae bacterium]|nr:aminodeoxychorismate/anthranilate synthase component II [Chitinophagaceae bacterium]